MLRHAPVWMIIILAVGCGSDNELKNDLGNPSTQDNTDPTNPTGGTTTDTDTDTDTDTYTTDTDTNTTDDPPTTDTAPPNPTDTGLTDEEICEAAAALASFLDPYQTAKDDRVLYCHSGGSNWVLVESDISSCLPHLNHPGDVFPTSGCDT